MCTGQVPKTKNAEALEHLTSKFVTYHKKEGFRPTWVPNQGLSAESPMN